MRTQEMSRDGLGQLLNAPLLYRSQVGVFLLRVGVALLILCHGWSKLVILLAGEGGGWMDPLGIGSAPSLALCVFAEFFCGVAVLVGFFTRAASFVLVINFWVAVFVYGREAAWPQNELPLLYMICFAALIGTGSGPLALDRVFTRRFNEQGTSPLAP